MLKYVKHCRCIWIYTLSKIKKASFTTLFNAIPYLQQIKLSRNWTYATFEMYVAIMLTRIKINKKLTAHELTSNQTRMTSSLFVQKRQLKESICQSHSVLFNITHFLSWLIRSRSLLKKVRGLRCLRKAK